MVKRIGNSVGSIFFGELQAPMGICHSCSTRHNSAENESSVLLDSSQRYFKTPDMVRRDLDNFFGAQALNKAELDGQRLSNARQIALQNIKPSIV